MEKDIVNEVALDIIGMCFFVGRRYLCLADKTKKLLFYIPVGTLACLEKSEDILVSNKPGVSEIQATVENIINSKDDSQGMDIYY